MEDKQVTTTLTAIFGLVKAGIMLGQANPKIDPDQLKEVIETLVAKELMYK
jgi:hypothetical protein